MSSFKNRTSSTRVRIATLKLRVPGGNVRSAQALARAVAAQLAPQASELSGSAQPRVRVRMQGGDSQQRVTSRIVAGIVRGGR